MSKDAFYRIIAKALKLPEGQINDDLSSENTAGWDSMAQLKIILMLEAECGIAFHSEELLGLTSIRKLQDALETLGVAVGS